MPYLPQLWYGAVLEYRFPLAMEVSMYHRAAVLSQLYLFTRARRTLVVGSYLAARWLGILLPSTVDVYRGVTHRVGDINCFPEELFSHYDIILAYAGCLSEDTMRKAVKHKCLIVTPELSAWDVETNQWIGGGRINDYPDAIYSPTSIVTSLLPSRGLLWSGAMMNPPYLKASCYNTLPQLFV